MMDKTEHASFPKCPNELDLSNVRNEFTEQQCDP